MFEHDGDDVVTKPFSYPELRGRIRALLRRAYEPHPAPVTRIGALSIDHRAREAAVAGRPIALPRRSSSCSAASPPSRPAYSPSRSCCANCYDLSSVHSGDGYIHVSGSTATLALDTGNGGIKFDDVSGDVSARTGEGGISGAEVSSKNVQASTGNGGINIVWSVAPTTVVATSGNGGIHVVVPQGSGPYRTSTHTGNGSVDVTALVDSTAASSITAETGNGGISVGYPNP